MGRIKEQNSPAHRQAGIQVTVNPNPLAMFHGAIKKSRGHTRRAWVVDQILRSIFNGEFRGGDRLVEEENAATMGGSRTPIREAFAELSGIGLITIKPNHGAVVRPLGPTQIREIYQIRCLLEGEATFMATDRIDREALREIREK